MVKLILPNSAPPVQESQKCLENKCTALVTSRKTLSFITSRSQKNFVIGHLAQRHSIIGRRHPSSQTRFGHFVPLRFSRIRQINIYFEYYGEKLIVETFGGVDLGVDFLIVITDGGVNPALALLKVDIVSRDLCT